MAVKSLKTLNSNSECLMDVFLSFCSDLSIKTLYKGRIQLVNGAVTPETKGLYYHNKSILVLNDYPWETEDPNFVDGCYCRNFEIDKDWYSTMIEASNDTGVLVRKISRNHALTAWGLERLPSFVVTHTMTLPLDGEGVIAYDVDIEKHPWSGEWYR